ncbi:MAG: hypothetical protein J4400_05890 [Candidatus Aenigmarchaeota archaeon]|nr:hypothetical protein [Candidatus Aenigmarchaeota archaeon]
MKPYIILLLLAVIVASGCVATSNRNPNDAIVINEFSADPPLAEPDDVVNMFLDIENVGGTTARCVTAELYGDESWYNEMGQPLSYARPWRSNGLSFDYNNGQLYFNYWDNSRGAVNVGYERGRGVALSAYVSGAWGQFTNNFCGAAAGWTQFSDVKYFDSIRAAVPVQNKPGQSFTTQWIRQPPVLPEGIHTSYPLTARVSYLYTTNAHVNLVAYNKAEAQRRELLGEQLSFPIAIENSHAAPVQVAMTRGINPIVVNQRAENYELANYVFEFQNVGNGWPLPFESDVSVPNGFIFATVELSGPGTSFYDCLGADSGTEIFVYGDVVQNLVKLRADKRAPFGCTIAIDRAAWADTPTGTVSLTFNLWYRYYTDAQISVDVLGRQENI